MRPPWRGYRGVLLESLNSRAVANSQTFLRSEPHTQTTRERKGRIPCLFERTLGADP